MGNFFLLYLILIIINYCYKIIIIYIINCFDDTLSIVKFNLIKYITLF